MFAIFDLIQRLLMLSMLKPDPELYYKASIEIIFFCIVISFFITMAFNRDYLSDNFSLHGGGYNNACVLFDMPPSRYVVAPFFVLSSYLGLRYTVTDFQRMYESSFESLKKPSMIINLLHAISMICLPILLIVTPDMQNFTTVIVHTLMFIFMIFTNTLVVIFRYITAYIVNRQQLNTINVIYLIAYMFFTIGYIVCFGFTFAKMRPNKYIFMTFDYGWVSLYFLSKYFFLDLIDDLNQTFNPASVSV